MLVNCGKCLLHGWKEDSMLIKRRAAYTIYLQPQAIARYWSEIATFPTPLHLTPPLEVFPLEFREKV